MLESIYDHSKNHQEAQDSDCIVRGYIYENHNNKDNSIKTPIIVRIMGREYTLFVYHILDRFLEHVIFSCFCSFAQKWANEQIFLSNEDK